MASLNKVTLLGRLGKDPEKRTIPSGQSVVDFSIATSETWKDKDGQKQERTEWHNCQFWGKQADVIAQYFKKGSQIYVEGSLTTDKYEKEGQTHYSTKIKGREFQFIDQLNKDGQNQQQPQGQAPSSQPAPGDDFVEDDIPF